MTVSGEVMNNSDMKQDFAIANVSCQYDGSPGEFFIKLYLRYKFF